MRKRKLVLLLLPALFFLWIIGWSLYTAGSHQSYARARKKQARNKAEETIGITVNLPQQQEIPQ